MGESYKRERARLKGETPEPMHLYPETEEIAKSFQTLTNEEGWNCFGNDMEFDTLEDAYEMCYKNEDSFIARMAELFGYTNAK